MSMIFLHSNIYNLVSKNILMYKHIKHHIQKIVNLYYPCVCAQLLSCVHLFATLQTLAHQASLSMKFSRQECWSDLPFSPPGDLSNTGIELTSPVSLGLVSGFFNTEPPVKTYHLFGVIYINKYMNNLVVFPTFFNLSLNFALRSS